jgi:23S rRNA (pseudouridine1915-N3)-methyltransferase
MRLAICAVGRLRAGPERALADDYLIRFAKLGRGQGLPPVDLHEVDAKGGGMAAEAELLRARVSPGARLVPLDERGATLTSPQFAARLAGWRDEAADVAFLIGGADGLDATLRNARDAISFGPMVWPHALARAMLAEQLYRAASILGGGPYHRA